MTKEGSNFPLTKVLLQIIAAVSQAGIDYVSLFYDIKYYGSKRIGSIGADYVAEIKKLQNDRVLKQTLRQLKKSKYIKEQKTAQRLLFYISKKGLRRILTEQMKTAPAITKDYLVVIFDIPKTQNQSRQQLRWLLRQGGFKMLQQSVWVSKKDSYALLKKFISEARLGSWVNVFYGKNFLTPPNKY